MKDIIPNDEEINKLGQIRDFPCLSIYSPYVESNYYKNSSLTQINNILRGALKILNQNNVNEKLIGAVIKPIQIHFSQYDMTSLRDNSTVIFSSPDYFKILHIPGLQTPPIFKLLDSFFIQPLVSLVSANNRYYLLCLSQNKINFFIGDRYSLEEITLNKSIKSMEQTLMIDEYPKSRETHSVAPAYTGKGSEGFHQQYNVAQTNKKMLKNFLYRVEKEVWKHINNKRDPLILAGDKYPVYLYKKISDYAYINDKYIIGNQDYTDINNLRIKALNILNLDV